MKKSEFEAYLKVFTTDENNILHPYKDHLGNWTIGIGHLIGHKLEDLKITDRVSKLIFRKDLLEALDDAYFIFGEEFFKKLEIGRKAAILTLCFGLGRAKLLTFHHTVPAIKNEDWEAASNYILSTKWASDVDPKKRHGIGRDDRVAYMLRTGLLHPEYNL